MSLIDLPPGYEPPSPVEEAIVEEVQAEETTQPGPSLGERAELAAKSMDSFVDAWLAGYQDGFKDGGGKLKKARKQGSPTGKSKKDKAPTDPERFKVYISERESLPGSRYGDNFDGPYRLRVGYAKLGRTIDLDPDEWGQNGGDNEPPILLNKIALRNPDVQFVLVGKNSGDDPATMNLPPNVVNPWTDWKPIVAAANKGGRASDRQYAQNTLDEVTRGTFLGLDGIIVWAGQHGTSNSRIPTVDDRSVWTEPQISFIHYGSFVVRGINAWRSEDPLNREEVWLVPDARNYIKARDLQWPTRHPLLSQFDWVRADKLERYEVPGGPNDHGFPGAFQIADNLWQAPYEYKYSRLEMVGIPSDTPFTDDDFADRKRFGIVINEARNYVKHNRLEAMQDYIIPLEPDFIYGRWTATSLKTLGREIEPLHYSKVANTVRTVKTTFTTPSSGSGWATTKPWESFASGVVCFMHPQYDTQGHVVPTLEQVERGDVDDDAELKTLATWLRVRNPEDLAKRVDYVSASEDTWKWIVGAQRRLYEKARDEAACIAEIEERLGITRVREG